MALLNKFHLATVRPTIDVLPNTAWSDANDVLFDWYPFEIPRGGCALKTLNVIVPGVNTAAASGVDMEIFFAKSVNGVAPPSLGDPDSAVTKIAATACKNHIIGQKYLDASHMENGDLLGSYNIWTTSADGAAAAVKQQDVMQPIILEGDPNYTGTTKGYQTIWIAALTMGTPDHGTNVILEGAVSEAGAQTLDVTADSSSDADDVFAIGDELLAAASDGSSVQTIGTITALTAASITVDAKDVYGNTVWESGALADDDEICFRRPFTFNLGLEY